ncbi:TMEM165/GDT1 family protein [Sphingomonas hengshuiensis]|uniref:GDT1 family protein n=1 Tax=Sphingomonas hengshuiensis TaxID=1609977 RepID=A0A7U5BEM5_9SPHN|nr:TMEM165/GDT1 family protein [Sphingomonas hengshuiensis]AJP70835.1 hypothetical protein TS85_01895 [Sphingomonas hengshuiensis]
MEAIVPAFLLALLTQIGDRPALLTAILADRYAAPIRVAIVAGLVHAAIALLAALGGAAIGPGLSPHAARLLLGVALVMAGIGGLWPSKPPAGLEAWRNGAVVAPLLGALVSALGDRGPFVTLALAAGGLPWFAAAGATLGAFAVALVAAVLGERCWQALPLRRTRGVLGVALLGTGLYLMLGALGLA